MAGRSLAALVLVALALSLLLLFSSEGASATTWKLAQTTTLSSTTAGANADVATNLNIADDHSNFSALTTTGVPSEWGIATDAEIPNGSWAAQVVVTSTLAVVGSCNTTVVVSFNLFEATTNVTDTVDWAGDGTPMTLDPDGNGLPQTIDQYPSFLNTMFNGAIPRLRYSGYATPISGAPPTHLSFVMFNPSEFVGSGTTWQGLPLPSENMGDALGYMNFIVQDNPLPGNAAPSAVQDFCAPLISTSTLYGKTKGEAMSVPANGGAEVTGQCIGAQVGVDNDADTTVDDGCIVPSDICTDSLDNDGDGWTNEGCDLALLTNPAANTGIYGSNTHLFTAYGESQRDLDADGLTNGIDGCPTLPDRPAAAPGGTSREVGAECGNAADDDADTVADDGCGGASPPVAEKDGDGDGIGDICDPTIGADTNGGDHDLDGYNNRQDNCPLVANGIALDNQLDNDLERCGNATSDDGADDAAVNDGCPLAGTAPESYSNAAWTAGQCSNNTDDDGDTVINDGCPMLGSYSEQCVNTAGGACNDAMGNACDADDTVADGAFAVDLIMSAVCIGVAADDTDTDGWCNATETLFGSNPASNTSKPEHQALDYKMAGSTIAAGVCNDTDFYVSTGDDIVPSAVDNDGDGGNNAGELDGADPGAVTDCAADASDGADQDGVYAAVTALRNATDNCASDWNPEQLNTDAIDDAVGDACDLDDDADGPADIAEWKRGTDPKNFQSPRIYDVNNDGAVNINDVLSFGGAVDTSYRLQPMTGQGKQQPWTYTFTNNTGFTIDRLRLEFGEAAKLTSITDSGGNTWICKTTGLQKLGCRTTAGSLAIGGTVTLKASANAERNLACWIFHSSTTARGGSYNATDCASITLP
jgi:hypothetical protein